MTFEQIDFGPQNYIGIKRLMSFDEIKEKSIYAQAYNKIMAYVQQNKLELIGPPVNIYFTWDPVKQETEIGIAFPVKEGIEVDDTELESMRIEKTKAVKTVHMGDYMNLKDTHEALMAYLKENKLELNKHVIEEYVTNPEEEPDTSKLITNVFYTIK